MDGQAVVRVRHSDRRLSKGEQEAVSGRANRVAVHASKQVGAQTTREACCVRNNRRASSVLIE